MLTFDLGGGGGGSLSALTGSITVCIDPQESGSASETRGAKDTLRLNCMRGEQTRRQGDEEMKEKGSLMKVWSWRGVMMREGRGEE